jgi:LAO/AO transport system ATPase
VQIHGGYGFVKDYPAEKFFRDVKLTTIGEGHERDSAPGHRPPPDGGRPRLRWPRRLTRSPEPRVAGDPRAMARAISQLEDADGREGRRPRPRRRALSRHGRAFLVGITGVPGGGKSTLVDQLIATIRGAGLKVGVLAVDPTSPFSGGAVLGDRVRMNRHSGRRGVFVRSMATRGHLGGLARTTGDAALVLDAAGFDVVLIETVGVGQDEVDVAQTADATVVVLVPGTGDDVQAMKAGIMEIADVFVANKADREGIDGSCSRSRRRCRCSRRRGRGRRRCSRRKPRPGAACASSGPRCAGSAIAPRRCGAARRRLRYRDGAALVGRRAAGASRAGAAAELFEQAADDVAGRAAIPTRRRSAGRARGRPRDGRA